MAEVKETVLVEVEISKPDAEKEIDQITNSLSKLNDENKELLAANKALETQGQKNSKQYIDNSRQIEVNKQKITENTASRKGLIQALVTEDNSIKALSVRNRELINQRNQITTSTEQGRQKIAQINAEIDKNNATIRANSSALEKQKGNVGNYRDALNALSPALGNMISQLQTATRAALLFIATPLGAVLAAIGLALTPVISYLKNTGEGADFAAKELEGLRAVGQSLADDFNKLGKSILNFFERFTPTTGNPFKKRTSDLEEAREAGRRYAEGLDELRDAEADYAAQAAKTENQIKRLILESKNRTLSEDERIKKLDEALALEATLQNKREEFAKTELSLTVERNRARLAEVGIIQKASETQQEFVENNIKAIRDFNEDLAKSLNESLKKIEDATGSSIAIEEKAQNQRDALLDKQEEADKKRAEERRKLREEEAQHQLEVFNRTHNEEFFAQEEANEQKAEQEQDFIDRIAEINNQRLERERKDANDRKKLSDQEVKNKEKAVRDIETLQQQALATASMVFGRNRAAASAITLADTYLGAQKAYASQLIPGDPTSLIRAQIAAVLTTIQGLARVALINGIQFAKGGILSVRKFFGGGIANNGGVISGPSHANGGVKFSVGGKLGFEAEGGEAIINRKSTAMFRNQLSAINQAGGGVKFASGGVAGSEIRSVARGIERQFTNPDTVFQPVLVLEDFEMKQTEVNNVKNRAVVISG